MTPQELKLFNGTKIYAIQLKVASLLFSWISHFYQDFSTSPPAMAKLKETIDQLLELSDSHKSIEALLEVKQALAGKL